jgi:hypothetical protein
VVDSRLPVRGADTQVLRGANAAGSRRRKADEDEFRPAYSRAAGNQLWVPLVEKAHAKAHGSYHAISGGWISEGLVDLTGCPTESLRLRWRVGAGSSERLDATWARLLSYAAARFPMGCATHRGDAARGIVGGHAYSVMDVREVRGLTKGRQTTLGESRVGCPEIVAEEEAGTARRSADETLRLVRVRNPWGRKEWNGEWGTGSEVWTKKLGAELGHVRADDGTFWMSFRDFVSRFSRVDVCVGARGLVREQPRDGFERRLNGVRAGARAGRTRGVVGVRHGDADVQARTRERLGSGTTTGTSPSTPGMKPAAPGRTSPPPRARARGTRRRR